jgi:hypothetical protein
MRTYLDTRGNRAGIFRALMPILVVFRDIRYATGSVLNEGCVDVSIWNVVELSHPHKQRTELSRAVASLDVWVP